LLCLLSLPIYYLHIWLPIYLSFIYLPTYYLHTYLLDIYLPNYILFTYIFIYTCLLTYYLPTYLLIYLLTYLPTYLLSTYIPIYLVRYLPTNFWKFWNLNLTIHTNKNFHWNSKKHVKCIWYHIVYKVVWWFDCQNIGVEPTTGQSSIPYYQHILCEILYSYIYLVHVCKCIVWVGG
jgi:hypothetical protein